ncbi:MAG: alanine--tRNA ligase-related protein, partial [Candidatus Aenigmatarchaeota archaeon]
LSLSEVAEWHAEELEGMFPELKERIEDVKKILDVEREKYEKTKKETERIVQRLSREELTEERMVELYDSKGVTPQMLEEEFDIEIPQNFYSKVAEKHEEEEEERRERTVDISGIEETERLYYDRKEFEGTVVGVVDDYVAFDRTAFYPTSGGQVHDKGEINGMDVEEVIMEGKVVLHRIPGHDLKKGDSVRGEVDRERRNQITQHHSATHIVNVSSREVLGSHVWQAGAYKDMEKGRLDITHYEIPSEEEIRKIEERANEIVGKKLPVEKTVMDKNVAEERYGFVIYQGGVVPGNQIRIVKIDDLDAEACGGTHVDNTEEVGNILITDVKKLQDSVIRLEFTAGERTRDYLDEIEEIAQDCKDILGCEIEEVPEQSERLFERWKKSKKELEGLEEKLAERMESEMDFEKVSDNKLLVESLAAGMDELENISKDLTGENTCILLFGVEDEKINILGSSGESVDVDVGDIVEEVSEKLGGDGGGSPKLGQGFGKDREKLDGVLEEVRERLKQSLGE